MSGAADQPLRELSSLAGMDIYLIDQLMKGRVAPGARVIDVGAGSGRNLMWFLRAEGRFEVAAVEPSADAWAAFEERAHAAGVSMRAVERIHCRIEDLDLVERRFDLVICNAVLHFAADPKQFGVWLRTAWGLVAAGGLLFIRLATTIGLEGRVTPLGNGWYRLPDESDRFLVSQEDLLRWTATLDAQLADPIKTTNVQGLRAMTTWVLAAREEPRDGPRK